MDGTWAFFFAPRARVSRYRPRRIWHLGLRPGMSVAPCRHMGWGLGVLNFWKHVFRDLGIMFLVILEF